MNRKQMATVAGAVRWTCGVVGLAVSLAGPGAPAQQPVGAAGPVVTTNTFDGPVVATEISVTGTVSGATVRAGELYLGGEKVGSIQGKGDGEYNLQAATIRPRSTQPRGEFSVDWQTEHGEGYNFGALGRISVVGGGAYNLARGIGSVVAGGSGNTAEGHLTTVVGGQENTASNTWAVVLGGYGNTADGTNAVAFGFATLATNHYAVVWNGVPSLEFDIRGRPRAMYGSHGFGTFNINPVGGPAGFYIGDASLADIIRAQLGAVPGDSAGTYYGHVRLAANAGVFQPDVLVPVNWDTVVANNGDFYSAAARAFIAPVTGLYAVHAHAQVSSVGAAAYASIVFLNNGVPAVEGTRSYSPVADGALGLVLGAELLLQAGSTSTVAVCSSDGTPALDGGAARTWLTMRYLGPQP